MIWFIVNTAMQKPTMKMAVYFNVVIVFCIFLYGGFTFYSLVFILSKLFKNTKHYKHGSICTP